jgi:hypothetical protein
VLDDAQGIFKTFEMRNSPVKLRYLYSVIGLTLAARIWAADAPDAFQAVCADLRAVTEIQADFEEDKTLKILAHPLHSQGTLHFSQSQGIYRVMTTPVHQEMLITRAQFVQKNAEGAIQRMSVRKQPAARAFVDVFLSFFSGDQDAWKKVFDVTFAGTREEWKITFAPKRKNPAAQFLHNIVLEGREGILNAMTLTEVNGDVTHTVYSNQHAPTDPFPTDLSAA